jgi:hypothetical protein
VVHHSPPSKPLQAILKPVKAKGPPTSHLKVTSPSPKERYSKANNLAHVLGIQERKFTKRTSLKDLLESPDAMRSTAYNMVQQNFAQLVKDHTKTPTVNLPHLPAPVSPTHQIFDGTYLKQELDARRLKNSDFFNRTF